MITDNDVPIDLLSELTLLVDLSVILSCPYISKKKMASSSKEASVPAGVEQDDLTIPVCLSPLSPSIQTTINNNI